MAFPPNSLRAFLSHAKTSLRTAIEQSQKVTLVIGNESADLDSLSSSLLYAYLRSLRPPRTAFTPLYIPLLNISASDIRIRPEFTALFCHANISESHLITRDDLPPFDEIEKLLRPATTRWLLVDHNKMQGELGSIYSTRVRGVIDHHEEENAVTQDTDSEPRVVEKCGSCTSLVVQNLKSAWDHISSSSLSSGAGHAQGDSLADDDMVRKTWDAQVAKMALASILIDTLNLKSESKVVVADREAVEYLEAKIKSSPKDAKTWSRDEFYNEINEAKNNINDLEVDEILRKDYKAWTENGMKLGISSVVKPLDFLVTKVRKTLSQPDEEGVFDAAINNFIKSRDLAIFAIMTISHSPDQQFRRELFMQAASRPGSEAISRFSQLAGEELGLEDLDVDGISLNSGPDSQSRDEELLARKIWLQKDVSKSRKQVAPLLHKAMR